MAKLSEYILETRQGVLEVAGETQYDMGEDPYGNFVRRALRRYSIDKPLIKVSAITGSDTRYITVNSTNLPDYVDGSSKITQIEAKAPVIASNELPNFLDRDEWDLYRDETALRIHLKTTKPSSSDTIRVTYTIPHTINELDSETVDSVPDLDKDAIVLYAVSQALMALAAKFSGTSDPTLRADVVNYRTKSQEYRMQSEAFKKMYNEWISDPLKAASIVRDINFGFSFADNQPFLTHRSASRR